MLFWLKSLGNKREFKHLEYLFYIVPAIIILLFVYLYPLIKNVQISFQSISGSGAYVGFKNYIILFKDATFLHAILNNLIFLTAVPVLVILSIIFAVILFERFKVWKFYRFIIFIPVVLAIPVVGAAFSNIFQLNGVLNQIFEFIGLKFLINDWLASSKTALFTVMAIFIWKDLGFGVILFFARLVSISESIFDAAKIDGANWFQTLFHVIIPQLASIIKFFFLIEIITVFSGVFSYVYVMTFGGPGDSTTVLEYYIYKRAFYYNQQPLASIASLFLIIIVFAFIFSLFYARIGGLENE